MSAYSVVDFIKEFYPEYYGYQSYPADKCAIIHKVKEEWGIFCNFASTPLVVNGHSFKTSEELYQLMKFTDTKIIERIRSGKTREGKNCYQIKKTVKSYEKLYRRDDWGKIFLDAMKFTLTKKYEQSEEFRQKLQMTKDMYIIEDQTAVHKKTPDSWGVKLNGANFEGPNLLGRLLMELRDNGKLEYSFPEGTSFPCFE